MARRPHAPRRPAAPGSGAPRSGAHTRAPGAPRPRPARPEAPEPAERSADHATDPQHGRAADGAAGHAAADGAGRAAHAGSSHAAGATPEPGSARRTTTRTEGDAARRAAARRAAARPATGRSPSHEDAGAGSVAVGTRAGRPEPDEAGDHSERGRGAVVHAADRFRDLVRPRPWRRRRRTLAIVGIAILALLVAALVAVLTLPAFEVQKTSVSGISYVDESAVDGAVASARGTSELLLPTSDLEAAVEKVPGVRSATVERQWPDGMHVTVTERRPLATVTDAAGTTVIVDADGKALPDAAGKGHELVSLQVGEGAVDHSAATSAMLDVLASLPEDLRGRVTAITATTASDVTLAVSTDDGDTKTLVWGDAKDGELKAKVTDALLDEPGTVIDVSAPSAPVTR
ncbi:FtsQ-type POTRA domain-containing protein [Brachybacterium huguangmaarense]|uniref:FtsQ-type POTRA domain-containing protein n=1 Tax=Brachybacterium huguangmaarense TaxID=1652028 RepID=A0ABY6FXD2_9MICO|nr:FtsQ-type POTRA domain-containing protein [Brachybacterium huguangmaarense]UYG15569.1 FtsQ-type POTRA domain-containing protein [Brachybacterium huguangmaarense]